MNCIYCQGRPRRGKGLFCPECEAETAERVMGYWESPLLLEARHWLRMDAQDLARHYAKVAGLPPPYVPKHWRSLAYVASYGEWMRRAQQNARR